MPKISIILFLLELHTQIINIEILNNDLISPLIGGIDNLNLSNNSISELTNNLFAKDTNYNILKIFKNVLLISSLLSLIIGTVVGLAQVKIKRLLAYSTISHIGFILLALAVNTEQSIESLIFYIIQYSITNLNTFLIILAFGYLLNNNLNFKYGSEAENQNSNSVNSPGSVDLYIKFISELKGQFYLHPFLSVSLIICLFSMAGIPPLIGFFSKQFVLYSAIESGYYFLSVIAIVVSVISASYYLKIIKILISEAPSIDLAKLTLYLNKKLTGPKIEINIESYLTHLHSLTISILTLSILLFILKPSILLNSTKILSLSFFNF